MENNKRSYLFVYNNDFIWETFSDSVKSAIVDFCNYTSGEKASNLLKKALVGFNDEQEIKEMIEVYNKICSGFYEIVSIYLIEKKLYFNM